MFKPISYADIFKTLWIFDQLFTWTEKQHKRRKTTYKWQIIRTKLRTKKYKDKILFILRYNGGAVCLKQGRGHKTFLTFEEALSEIPVNERNVEYLAITWE